MATRKSASYVRCMGMEGRRSVKTARELPNMMESKSGEEEQQTKILKEKLQQLNCPYVFEMDDCWIQDMLFKPGDSRLRLFHWLIEKLCPKLFSQQVKFGQSFNEVNYSKMQNVLHDLGIGFDPSVIQGKAPSREQASLLNFIIDVLTYRETVVTLDDSSFSKINHQLCNSRIQEYKFLDDIADNAASCDISTYLPYDIITQFKKSQSSKCARKATGRLSNLKNMRKLIEPLDMEIQEIDAELNALPSVTLNPTEIDKLKLTSEKLGNCSSLFMNVYKNEMEMFCRQPKKSSFSELGSTCDTVYENLQRFTEVCDNISTLNDLKSTVPMHQQHLDKLFKMDDLSAVSDDLLKYSSELKQSINELKKKQQYKFENN